MHSIKDIINCRKKPVLRRQGFTRQVYCVEVGVSHWLKVAKWELERTKKGVNSDA